MHLKEYGTDSKTTVGLIEKQIKGTKI